MVARGTIHPSRAAACTKPVPSARLKTRIRSGSDASEDFMRRLLTAFIFTSVSFAACLCERPSSAPKPTASSVRPASQVESFNLVIAYGSEKRLWLEEQAKQFMQTGAKTKTGKPIQVQGRAMGSGEATQDILSG